MSEKSVAADLPKAKLVAGVAHLFSHGPHRARPTDLKGVECWEKKVKVTGRWIFFNAFFFIVLDIHACDEVN